MAARTQNKLTDLAVRKAKEPGWYGDGGGLWLRVESATAKRWVFIFAFPPKKRIEMGLGAVTEVGLGEARSLRDAAKALLREGKNPVEERRLERERAAAEAAAAAPLTFAQWAEQIAPDIAPKPPKTRKVWLKMMTTHCGPMAHKPPAEVTTDDVLRAIKPYWTSRPETADKMRRRIEHVLDAAKAKGLIQDPWLNPARWRGHLSLLLEKRTRKANHYPALPYDEMPEFMARLRPLAMERVSAAAVEFTILTLVRNVEARGARRGEFDLTAAVWTIPAERMKGKEGQLRREHVVPLSPPAVDLVRRVFAHIPDHPEALLFPTPSPSARALRSAGPGGVLLSENALQNVIRDMGLQGRASVHGFRSTFKDWATDCTNFPDELSEEALAHLVGDKTRRAYRRGDALLKRRKLMEAWAGYLARPAAAGDNVRPLSRVGG